MTIGLLEMDVLTPGARSLKDKRRIIKSLKQLLHNRFNCSVAETGDKDLWGRAQLAVCVVSDDARHANEQLNEIVRFSADKAGAELIDYRIEML
ncbi:MAG TPA: DUF503 domain-containing protein [Candidatus Hydrogenedentes bacterium]|mgnify:CR=1 FL=1|nr:DUF503 domain-containing protein [Candidatus Hydrogenedentota bacterium]